MSNQKSNFQIAGLIVAAGRSERMGSPKLNLSWGDTTVLGQVIRALADGGVTRVFVVINPLRKPLIPDGLPDIEINWIENPAAETSEMLTSIQTGLSALPQDVQFALICLGDQPTIRPDVVQTILNALINSGGFTVSIGRKYVVYAVLIRSDRSSNLILIPSTM
jgi:CTP:molybdopterin cytidylyltransferase MocA